jgi:hypothetical protein
LAARLFGGFFVDLLNPFPRLYERSFVGLQIDDEG